MAISEYDAFGPWIYEVTEKHPLPPQFEGHIEPHDYDILIKIPRDIERRKANPDMPLYNYVIGCIKDTVFIYERNELEIHKHIIKISELCALKDYRDMLLGKYQFFMLDQTISFHYNTVSSDMVTKMTNWIRSRLPACSMDLQFPSIENGEVAHIDPIYSNLFHQMLRTDDSLQIIALQPKTKLNYTSLNPFQRVYRSVMNSHLQSSLYLKSNQDMVLLQRSHPFTRLGFADYSNTFTFIPYHSISNAILEPSTVSTEVQHIQIQTKKHSFDAMFSSNNPYLKGYVDFLKECQS